VHSPEVVVFSINRPFPKISKRYGPNRSTKIGFRQFWYIGKWELYFPSSITVWHNEPDGEDSGTVCKGMGSSELTWHNVKWAIKHRKHLEIQVESVRSLHRWITDRCEGCGGKFSRHEPRFSFGWSCEREVYHNVCMRLATTINQLKDHQDYIDGIADSNQKFRVEYWSKDRKESNARI
jgi:hypothetical protein